MILEVKSLLLGEGSGMGAEGEGDVKIAPWLFRNWVPECLL